MNQQSSNNNFLKNLSLNQNVHPKLKEYILMNPDKVYTTPDCLEKFRGNCVYSIYSLHNNSFYIGKTKNYKKRLDEHRRGLNANRHHSKYLQHVWNKYGKDNFICFIVEYTDDLLNREIFWMRFFDSVENGYNTIEDTSKLIIRKDVIQRNKERDSKKVVALTPDGKFINIFSSVTEAANHYNSSTTNISGCCKGRIRSVKGCMFIYEKDYDKNKEYKMKEIDYSRLSTPERREFISKLMKGRKHTKEQRDKWRKIMGKAVKSLTDNIEFISINEAARYYDISFGCVQRSAKLGVLTKKKKLKFEYIN